MKRLLIIALLLWAGAAVAWTDYPTYCNPLKGDDFRIMRKLDVYRVERCATWPCTYDPNYPCGGEWVVIKDKLDILNAEILYHTLKWKQVRP
jgi:hypothetical protein